MPESSGNAAARCRAGSAGAEMKSSGRAVHVVERFLPLWQFSQLFGFAAGQEKRVVNRPEFALVLPGPTGRVTCEHARVAGDFHQKEPHRCEDEQVHFVDASGIADEIESLPDEVRTSGSRARRWSNASCSQGNFEGVTGATRFARCSWWIAAVASRCSFGGDADAAAQRAGLCMCGMTCTPHLSDVRSAEWSCAIEQRSRGEIACAW